MNITRNEIREKVTTALEDKKVVTGFIGPDYFKIEVGETKTMVTKGIVRTEVNNGFMLGIMSALTSSMGNTTSFEIK